MNKLATILLTVIVLASFAYSQSNQPFQWLHERPQGNTLRYVKMFDANNFLAVGFSGAFLKTTNGGASGTFTQNAGYPRFDGSCNHIYDAHFFNANTGVAVGVNGITRTTDGGATWNVVYTTAAASTTFYQVYFLNSTVGYACGTVGTLVKTTDGGATWATVASGVTTTLYDVWTPNDTLLLVSNSTGTIRRSTDAGATWTAITSGAAVALYRLDAINSSKIVATGASGKVYQSTDQGLTWYNQTYTLPTTSTFYDLDFVNDTVYVTGNSLYLYKKAFADTAWSSVLILPATQAWTSTMYATDIYQGKTVTVGALGLMQLTTNNTSPQMLVDVKKGGIVYDIGSFPGTGKVVTVGAPTIAGSSFDQIMFSTDNGQSWAIKATNKSAGQKYNVEIPVLDDKEDVKGEKAYSAATLRSIKVIDANTAWAVGSGGNVFKTTNGGTSWDSVAIAGLGTTQVLQRVDFTDANNGYLFSSTSDTLGTIWKTTDAGATWTRLKLGIGLTSSTHGIYGCSFLNANKGWVVNYTPKPYLTSDGGTTWIAQNLVDGWTAGFLYDIKMLNDSTGFAVGSAGKIYKTTNGGTLWDTLTFAGKASYSTTTFYRVQFLNSQVGMITGANGAVLRTSDGGATWISMNTAFGVINYALHFAQPNAGNDTSTVFVGGTNGGVFGWRNRLVPVELSSFSATTNGNAVSLAWTTATEVNNYGFQVERAFNNGDFKVVGFVTGNGTSVTGHAYNFVDRNLLDGSYTYRLKQMDLDGTYKYYSLNSEVEIGSPVAYNLSQNYPNPFNPSTTISYAIAKPGVVSIKLFNVLGKEVATIVNEYKQVGSYNVTFDARTMTSGVYFYTIKANDFSATRKMVLMK